MEDTSATCFRLEHPAECFVLRPKAVAAGAPPINATARTQTIIAGNFWLRALAVTWNASAQTTACSHLDAAGASFQGRGVRGEAGGPRRVGHQHTAPPAEAAYGGTETRGCPGGAPTHDTELDLRFMQSVQGRLDAHGDEIWGQETTDPRAICPF